MVSDKHKWREKAEGTLEGLDFVSHKKEYGNRDYFKLLWAIGAALISISYPEDK